MPELYYLKIKVSPSYQKLVTPLSATEYSDLKQSIIDHGQYNEIIVNKGGFVLDGHHRFKILNDLALKPKISIKNLIIP